MMPTCRGHVQTNNTRYELLSAGAAWAMHCKKKPPVEIDSSRRREAEPRVAAMATETSLSIARVYKNKAPLLFTITSQPTAQYGPPTDDWQ